MGNERFIVAEISKNWPDPKWAGVLDAVRRKALLASRFEEVIAKNLERGYLLHSFQFHRLMTGLERMNETIIAVFEKEQGPQCQP